mmetsp:Transcript_101977/g.327235  ORF Transcript_101977/g.327235 Transcript_101977/m.327235 type:complete len:285 (-) Transcript_101977:1155-2009(-)
MFCTRDEVQEGVPLRQVLALLFVPMPAHLTAAADVRQDVDHAAVQVWQDVRVETWINADAVRAVAIQHAWPWAFGIQDTLQAHHAHRDALTVRGLGEDATALVLARVQARHLLAPDPLHLPRSGLILHRRPRCGQRAVLDAQLLGTRLPARANFHLVQLLLEAEAQQRRRVQRAVQNPNLRQPGLPAFDANKVGHGDDTLDVHRRVVWQHLGPAALAALPGEHRADGDAHQLVFHGLVLVRPNQEILSHVIQVVAQAELPRLHDHHLRLGACLEVDCVQLGGLG